MFPLPVCRWVLPSPRLIALGLGVVWLCGVVGVASAAQPAPLLPELPAELTAAARDYRIEIYGAFRTNRAEYDLRRKQAEALVAEWQNRGARPDEVAALVRWFDDARRAAARQQPLPASPNWNGAAEELMPIPSRHSLPHRARPTPLLRALPVQRLRTMQQVQVTTISAAILEPRESDATAIIVSAMPTIESLSLVLALAEAPRGETPLTAMLAKREVDAPIKISSNTLALPAAKLNPHTLGVTTPGATTDEAAELNTAELRARLRGYDKAWRALQVDLYSDEELTLERADALLTILNDLQQARRDLLLYQAIAPAELREEVSNVAALEELQKQLRQIMQAARTNAAADLTSSPAQRAAFERAWVKLLQAK